PRVPAHHRARAAQVPGSALPAVLRATAVSAGAGSGDAARRRAGGREASMRRRPEAAGGPRDPTHRRELLGGVRAGDGWAGLSWPEAHPWPRGPRRVTAHW